MSFSPPTLRARDAQNDAPDETSSAEAPTSEAPLSEAPLFSARWTRFFLFVGALAFFIKLGLAWSSPGTQDIETFRNFSEILANSGGLSVYHAAQSADSAFNYLPFVLHLVRGVRLLADFTHWPFSFCLRLVSIVADVGSAFLLYDVLARRNRTKGKRIVSPVAFLIYLGAPVVIWISGFHGNTDAVMMFFLLLSLWLLHENRAAWLVGAAFGMSLNVKLMPLALLPLLLIFLRTPRRRFEYSTAALTTVFIGGLPYFLQQPVFVLHRALAYNGLYGIWGVPRLLTAILADLAIVNGGGPSFFGDGGGIRAYSTGSSALVINDFLALQRVRISASRSQLNGGGLALAARGQLWQCEFLNNYANSTGGALTLGPAFGGGDTTIELVGSTVSGNQSPSGFSGGGGIKTTARLRVVDSTIAGNSSGYHGGGIYFTGTGSLEVRSSTVVGNTANAGGGSANGGGIRVDSGNLTLANAILANNLSGSGAGTPDDCTANAGTLVATYSLVKNAPGCAFTGSGNITGIDPGLDATLATNGGVTKNYALLSGSAAIDAGDPAGCTGYLGETLATDQRGAGFPRSQGPRCDIGAYESAAITAAPGVPDLDPASDSGSSSSDDLTNAATLNFTGSCVDGDTIQLQLDTVTAGSSTTCASSTYAIGLSSISEGAHIITATATRNATTSAATPALNIQVDRSAPDAPIVTAPVDTSAPDVAVQGSSEAGAIVDVIEGTSAVCSALADNAGAWTCIAHFVGGGAHALQAQATDAAGNTGAISAPFPVDVDRIFSDAFEH